jgi:predicted GNAT family acetyltransferase
VTTQAEQTDRGAAAPSLRVLGAGDLPAALDHLSRDPVANVFVMSRIEAALQQPWRLGGELWGFGRGRSWSGLCYSGANLVPDAGSDDAALAAFADRARRRGRRCSSIVGPRHQVLTLWSDLVDVWGPGREVRDDQPLMAIEHDPRIEPDPLVRPVRDDELDVLLPACIEMFTEEVGVSPVGAGDAALYRARVRELVVGGRALARIDKGRVVFKAELGSVSSRVCQVQGVWVHPDLRGQGLAAAGMATVVDHARRRFVPSVSLYVNGYNVPARRTYERVGFERVGTFATVLF